MDISNPFQPFAEGYEGLPKLKRHPEGTPYATIIPSDPPVITLGSLATDAPPSVAHGVFSDPNLFQPCSPCPSVIPETQLPNKPSKKMKFTQEDTRLKDLRLGNPSTMQEALNTSEHYLRIALSLAKGPQEHKTALYLVNTFNEAIQGKSTTSAIDNLHAAIDKVTKLAKPGRTHFNESTPSTNSTSTTPPSSREDSPSAQIRREQLPSQSNVWKEVQRKGGQGNLQNSIHNPELRPAKQTASITSKYQRQNNATTPRSIHHTKPKPQDPSRKLILTKEKEDAFTKNSILAVRDLVNKVLDGLYIERATISNAGNLILHTMTPYTAEDLLSQVDKIKTVIAFKKAYLDVEWYQVVIHGIPIKGNSVGQDFDIHRIEDLPFIKSDIEIFNKHLGIEWMGDGVNWLTSYEKRSNPNTFKASAILSVKTSQQQESILRNGILLLGTKVKAERLNRASPYKQCVNCQKFGHLSEHCRRPPTCQICSLEHKTALHTCDKCETKGAECVHSSLRCANCQGDHSASSKSCQSRPNPRKSL